MPHYLQVTVSLYFLFGSLIVAVSSSSSSLFSSKLSKWLSDLHFMSDPLRTSLLPFPSCSENTCHSFCGKFSYKQLSTPDDPDWQVKPIIQLCHFRDYVCEIMKNHCKMLEKAKTCLRESVEKLIDCLVRRDVPSPYLEASSIEAINSHISCKLRFVFCGHIQLL